MACDEQVVKNEVSRKKANEGLKDLARKLREKSASIVIDKRTGAVAIRGWRAVDVGMTDACAFRMLCNDPIEGAEARAIKAAAERAAGRTIDLRTAVHSHDGGKTWGHH